MTFGTIVEINMHLPYSITDMSSWFREPERYVFDVISYANISEDMKDLKQLQDILNYDKNVEAFLDRDVQVLVDFEDMLKLFMDPDSGELWYRTTVTFIELLSEGDTFHIPTSIDYTTRGIRERAINTDVIRVGSGNSETLPIKSGDKFKVISSAKNENEISSLYAQKVEDNALVDDFIIHTDDIVREISIDYQRCRQIF